jgi:arylsulfatase I/J
MDALVREGIELDRAYAFMFCSPSRSALQSGRNPYHVNVMNAEPSVYNSSDPESGYAGISRSMTTIATKLASVGYKTAMYGKWDAGMATPAHTPRGRGYGTALSYFHHLNDEWSQTVWHQSCQVGNASTPVVDLWLAREGHPEGG